MKRAILSDIHSNLEALEAVLADIDKQGIKEVFCLGDIVGYGPNPKECLEIAMGFDRVVLGNHDLGALFEPEDFNAVAEKAILWTRRQIEQGSQDTDFQETISQEEINTEANKRTLRWQFLAQLGRTHWEEDDLYLHASPYNPINDYVFPEDALYEGKMTKLFSLVKKRCFQGHTHVPGIFTEDHQFFRPTSDQHSFELKDQKYMINVGSVGQPRDGDPRACYVVLEGDRISYRRIEYPLNITQDKIFRVAELDNFLGERLVSGR
ncbi:MAG: metallophosphatase family protein [Pirellulaceae bacterium]|nr:metallophosphatase family protein [Pirellulaceae bacterium]